MSDEKQATRTGEAAKEFREVAEKLQETAEANRERQEDTAEALAEICEALAEICEATASICEDPEAEFDQWTWPEISRYLKELQTQHDKLFELYAIRS